MCFSIDPQLRVPEENRYLRYEDVIVITANGYENFTDFLPIELNDLEKHVGQGGVLQKASGHTGNKINSATCF
jgi:Xaa-Pro aminopeptidase